MRNVLIICMFYAIGLTVGFAQPQMTRMPSPINSPARERNPVMLPDGSVMLSVNIGPEETNWKCVRFKFNDGEWRVAPSQLDSLINSLIVTFDIPSFRFSNDFERVFVTLPGAGTYYESEKNTDGRWSLFTEIFTQYSVDLWHGLSVSDDHSKLYATSKKGVLYSSRRTEGTWGPPVAIVAFDKVVEEIQDPIAIGNDGLLFKGTYKSAKKGTEGAFFFSRLRADGHWSAPSKVEGVFGIDVAIAPSKNHFVFYHWDDKGDMVIGMAEVPKFLKNEIAKSGNKPVQQTGQGLFAGSDAAKQPDVVVHKLLSPEMNSPADESNPVMLPDSSIMLSAHSGKNVFEWRCVRFEYMDGKWKQAPAQLDSLINSLMFSSAVPNFRFSADFNLVTVTLHDGDRTRFFESEFVGRRWNLFREILPGNPLELWHGLSVSDDHSKLYASSRKGILYSFSRTPDGQWESPEVITAFNSAFEEIQEPIAIGADGLLFRARYKSGVRRNTDVDYFFARRLSNGSWSAPGKVEGLYGHDVSITPSRKHFLYCDFIPPNGDLGTLVRMVPKFLQDEMLKSNKTVATRQTKPESVVVHDDLAKPKGRYFALLIGNSNYKLDQLDLGKPASDVEVLFSTLTKDYQFEKGSITKLIDADRSTVISELYNLRSKVNATDNLLIFYAGHGHYDKQIQQGYWWPVDASPNNPASWISNSDLREQIRGINSKHTLLISDACFSGGIFRTRGAEELRKASLDIQQLYRMPSRRAMTSGTVSTVPDESVFFKYLIKYLVENKEPFISSSQLFAGFRTSVLNNSLTVPQDGVIMDTGDEGGDFIFIKR